MTMRSGAVVWLVALLAALALFAVGCQTDAARVCGRLGAIMEATGDSADFNEQACKDFVNEESARCPNFSEMVSCWIEAEDSSSFRSCRALCGADEEE